MIFNDANKTPLCLCVSEYCFTWLYVIYSAHYHRQHCTVQTFEHFGALYMHNLDDKHPTRLGFEPSTQYRVSRQNRIEWAIGADPVCL